MFSLCVCIAAGLMLTLVRSLGFDDDEFLHKIPNSLALLYSLNNNIGVQCFNILCLQQIDAESYDKLISEVSI